MNLVISYNAIRDLFKDYLRVIRSHVCSINIDSFFRSWNVGIIFIILALSHV